VDVRTSQGVGVEFLTTEGPKEICSHLRSVFGDGAIDIRQFKER
jgi:hypothetical protein